MAHLKVSSTLPPLSRDLIEALEKLFPEVEVNPSLSYGDILFRGGQRQVILFLRKKWEEQQNKIFN